MNECCSFHDLCELWNAHFNTMLSCVSLLVTAFGVAIPVAVAWFQHKSLRDERERLDKDMDRRFAELDRQQDRWDKDHERRFAELEKRREQLNKDTAEKLAKLQEQQQELISQQNSRLDKLQKLTSNAYVALANYYLDELMRFIVVFNDPTRTDERQQADMRKTILYFGNALQCLVNSRDREELVKIMATFGEPMTEIITKNNDLLAKTLDGLFKDYPSHNFFVTSGALAEITGPACSVYIKFVSGLQPLFEFVNSHYSSGDEERGTSQTDSAVTGNNSTQP